VLQAPTLTGVKPPRAPPVYEKALNSDGEMEREMSVKGWGLLWAAFLTNIGAAQAQTADYDAYNARDVMRTCAPCHGEFGQGGGGGAYPRLAGFNAEYLADQVRKFKNRERENIPMIPYATDRELPDRDILDVTRYLATVKLDTRLPEAAGPMDGLERLAQAKQVLQIPRADGDIKAGKELFEENCAACHGKTGEGRAKKPPLAGQYTGYLAEQVKNFITDKRSHEQKGDPLKDLKPQEIGDILAYASTLDD
jgi:cytochrome c553